MTGQRTLTWPLVAVCGLLGWSVVDAVVAGNGGLAMISVVHEDAPVFVPPDAGNGRFQLAPIEVFDDIVTRPLFVSSRRPVAGTGAAKAPVAVDLGIVLSGIVIDARQRLAQFKSADGRSRTAGLGETIENWRIEAIEAEHVILRAGDRFVTLYMRKPEPRRPATERTPPTGRESENPIFRGRPKQVPTSGSSGRVGQP